MDSKETPELQVSSAKDIRAKAERSKTGKLLKLPSGFVVRVGEPDLIEMVRDGSMPGDLIEVAINMKDGKASSSDTNNMPKFFDFLAKMVMSIVIEPKVVEKEPKENEIVIGDLSFEDKMAIFNDWRLEGETLKSFREEEQSNGEVSRPSMQKIPKQTTK